MLYSTIVYIHTSTVYLLRSAGGALLKTSTKEFTLYIWDGAITLYIEEACDG